MIGQDKHQNNVIWSAGIEKAEFVDRAPMFSQHFNLKIFQANAGKYEADKLQTRCYYV